MDELLQLYDAYCRAVLGGPERDRFDHHLLGEVRRRLERLRFLAQRVPELEAVVCSSVPRQTAEAFRLVHLSNEIQAGRLRIDPAHWAEMMAAPAKIGEGASLEAECLTEYFYYCAHRTKDAAQRLPGLKNFDSVGMRDVRNHLIEHPDKSSGVTSGGIQFGGGAGPVVKPERVVEQEGKFVDRGFHSNLAQFVADFTAALQRHLESKDGPEATR